MTDETGFQALTQVDGPLPEPAVIEPVVDEAPEVLSTNDIEALAMKLQLHTAMSRLNLRECREVLEFLEVQGVSLKTA